ncbi:NAD(P)/FAD-dependent oxidoreductase [Sabulicella rubraurantiaca]|uniref:NAD(P)/FAD-dependent oxidoreductase n=1 Tax=Sabulicella rubraurantiaca TaxID=2811429 RepID=UPI001A96602E|nr:FAD-dependent oxidoreductase [Sabulicella rubraurantiaca]
MRVLVIGAGPAGTRCAVRVAERLPGATVTLCGAEPALPYDRVALSRWLSGECEAEALLTHPLAVLRGLRIHYRPATRIAALEGQEAVTDRGERIGFDRAVIATGSRAIRLDVPGSSLPGVHAYRTEAEVRAMLRTARDGGGAVVVGGGLLGLEAADGLARRGMEVTVVHPVGWPMERQLDEGAGGLLAGRLRRRGIRFAMPAGLASIEGTHKVEAVTLTDGRRIPCRLVVMAVGIRPDTALAEASGIAVGRGILTDATLRTSRPDVKAIGECAEVEGRCIGLVAPALDQAEAAAARLAGELALWTPRADSAALKVSGTAVWSAGEIAPEAEQVVLLDREEEHYRRLFLREGRLVGAVLFGDVSGSRELMEMIASRRQVGSRAALALGRAG